jgi:hydroxyacylglutathione hydrolase
MEIKNIVVGALRTNCYLLYNKEELVVIDPGAEGEKILKEIEKINLPVKYIINTHSHFDHNTENSYLENKTKAVILNDLKEGDIIEIGEDHLQVMSASGHTKDSICLIGEGFLIGGDVLFENGYGRTDLPGGSKEEIEETLERLKRDIPDNYIVYPGHGRSFLMEEWDY